MLTHTNQTIDMAPGKAGTLNRQTSIKFDKQKGEGVKKKAPGRRKEGGLFFRMRRK